MTLEFMTGSRRGELQHLGAPGVFRVGCRSDCEVYLDPQAEPFVSGLHAELLVGEDRAQIRDLQSKNGTYLNGRRIDLPERIHRGDVVVLGYDGPRLRFDAEGGRYNRPVIGRTTVFLKPRELPSPRTTVVQRVGEDPARIVGRRRRRWQALSVAALLLVSFALLVLGKDLAPRLLGLDPATMPGGGANDTAAGVDAEAEARGADGARLAARGAEGAPESMLPTGTAVPGVLPGPLAAPTGAVRHGAGVERRAGPADRSPREAARGGLLFKRLAPAVVVVRGETGHGTGFFIDTAGTLLTNYHVVAPAIRYDMEANASYATVHLGASTPSGGIKLLPKAAKAYYLAGDGHKDLALLRLATVPEELRPLPHVDFSDRTPHPGMNCAIIGHPTSGMLYTFRSGEVASIGFAPHDIVDVYMHKLDIEAKHADEEALRAALAAMPRHKILLTTCGVNPGDSGGPVIDEDGRLIAVTFAKPRDPGKMEFSYHVHVDEVREFVAKGAETPALWMPPLYPQVTGAAYSDIDMDGAPDVLIGDAKGPNAFYIDLDNDTPLAEEDKKDAVGVLRRRGWECEAAFLKHGEDERVAYYDLDNDGTMDLILYDRDADRRAEFRFDRQADGGWKVADGKQAQLIDRDWFAKDEALAARFWLVTHLLFDDARSVMPRRRR